MDIPRRCLGSVVMHRGYQLRKSTALMKPLAQPEKLNDCGAYMACQHSGSGGGFILAPAR